MLELESRRKKVFDLMKDNSIAILFSGVSKVASEDEYLPFVANRNFFYLTNIEQEHSALLLIKGIGERKTYLFIDPYSELKEKWTGKRLTTDNAIALSDIKNVYTTDNFETMLSLALTNDGNQYGNIDCIYLDLSSPEQKLKDDFFMNDLSVKMKLDYNDKEIVDLYPLLRELRMVKSPVEIDNIVKAIEKTNNGISYIIGKLNPGMKEHELADHFEMYGRAHDRAPLAFSTIIASGKNATCLHYPSQNDVVKEDDLILFDLGYSYRGYSADISRTFPVSGKFNSLQRDIYQAVLNCNKAVIAYAKEGLTLKDLQMYAVETLKSECIRLKLMAEDDDIRNYYYHGVSHHLGLDTHDISDREQPLKNGNIITVEPGLYFAKHGIGVRIEDDVLITMDGAVVLSKNIVKEIDEIERMMARRG
ncbi:MAG: aminopeptidase P N-terminal domain-containing protein [Bacilli bacterium]|nr:aminopeptidase P N-terminal domain-containing protein [Bacilli bacterium]